VGGLVSVSYALAGSPVILPAQISTIPTSFAVLTRIVFISPPSLSSPLIPSASPSYLARRYGPATPRATLSLRPLVPSVPPIRVSKSCHIATLPLSLPRFPLFMLIGFLKGDPCCQIAFVLRHIGRLLVFTPTAAVMSYLHMLSGNVCALRH